MSHIPRRVCRFLFINMNKPPAFQFYPKDFLMDDKVIVMNLEEKGAYIVLLSYCWNNNGLTKNQKDLKNMCGNPENWELIWGKVGKCFYEKKGKFFNKRLEKELKKQKKWREKSRLGGIQSGISRGKMVEPELKGGSKVVQTKSEPPMNSSSSSSSSKEKKEEIRISSKEKTTKKTLRPEDKRLTQLLIDRIQENDIRSSHLPDTEEKQFTWINSCRLLREKDKRTSKEIEAIIIWSQNHHFWKTVILSMPKLREKFSQMYLKAKQEYKPDGIDEWLKEQGF